ncbi:hypothetical protein [Streptococcus oralis]|jgi:hypothetical protein|uniref:hypothetical protein n=1 Tax=Streptococcus oralis TaxID=1303 RepID=UPI00163988D3|nr:hypothetical protein [Streptococcus oralis]
MKRIDIIEKIGKDYFVSNIENEEFNYQISSICCGVCNAFLYSFIDCWWLVNKSSK